MSRKKIADYLVEVEVTTRMTVLVAARGEKQAEASVQTEAGWREATRYNEDAPYFFDSENMRVTRVVRQ